MKAINKQILFLVLTSMAGAHSLNAMLTTKSWQDMAAQTPLLSYMLSKYPQSFSTYIPQETFFTKTAPKIETVEKVVVEKPVNKSIPISERPSYMKNIWIRIKSMFSGSPQKSIDVVKVFVEKPVSKSIPITEQPINKTKLTLDKLNEISSKLGWGKTMDDLFVNYDFDVKQSYENGDNILFQLFSNNIFDRAQFVKFFIKKGANPNHSDIYGRRPLHIAAKKGELGIKELVEAGAEVGATDKKGKTALHYAAEKGMNDVAEVLIKYGAKVNTPDNFGGTALHYAIESGDDFPFIHFFVENGAKIDAVDNKGRTPLHYAALNSNLTGIKTVKLLIEKANARGIKTLINAKDKDGKTALDYALSPKDIQLGAIIIDDLKKAGAKRGFDIPVKE